MKSVLVKLRENGLAYGTALLLGGCFCSFCIVAVAAQEVQPQYFNASQKAPHNDRVVSSKPRYGGTLVWGTVNAPTIINPILTQNSVSSSLIGLIFNSLVKSDSRNQIVPDLAESWDQSPDGLTHVFHLRKGVHFHDGVEFTAEDVKFTFDAIADEKNHSPLRAVAQMDGQWQVMDKYTVKLVLRSPDPMLQIKLMRSIAPKHLLEKQDISATVFNYQPIGTGPFILKKWDRESNQIELATNVDYFEGRPYLDRIIVRTYPDNNRLWAALMRREVDFVRYLNQSDYLVLRTDPAFRTYAIPTENSCAMFYNLQDPVLADIKVREAIAMGIDVERLLKGIPVSGAISAGIFQANVSGFNPQLETIKYDPAKARALLNANGWRDEQNNGLLEKAGRPLEVRILIDDRSEYFQRIVMLIRQQLSEIGVKVVVCLYNDETMLSKEYLEENKIQAWLRFFRSAGDDPINILERFRFPAYSADGLWNYKNEEIDNLISLANKTQDEQERIQIFQNIHKLIYEDQPACFLFSPLMFSAVSARLQNTDDYFRSFMADYFIRSWFLGDSAGGS